MTLRMFLLCCACLFLSQTATAQSGKKFIFLLDLFDHNEAALAYHRHCLSSLESVDQSFMRTLAFVENALLEQGIKDNPSISSQDIRDQIMERRYNIQYSLDHAHSKDGCGAAHVVLAQKHYEMFSRYDHADIAAYIAGKSDNEAAPATK